MEKKISSWKRMRFKENKVWMAVDQNEKPIVRNGKVLIKYQLAQEYEYWVHEYNVHTLEPCGSKDETRGPDRSGRKPRKKKPDATAKKTELRKDTPGKQTIRIYTDGASSGNPGPAGLGAVLKYGRKVKEISKYIGIATNNVAELKAIEAGLADLKTTEIPVRIYTDSSYVHGVLSLGWKARRNLKLVDSVKELMEKFEDLQIIKVKGHAGHPENERADSLARAAIKNVGQ